MTPTIPPSVATRSATDFRAMPEAPCCSECGVRLNKRFGEGDPARNGYHVTDVRQSGSRKVLGSAYQCEVCAFDEAKQAARLRRVAKIRHRGDYL